MIEPISIGIKGHVIIKDLETNEIVLDKTNAIHPQNMASLISRAISRDLHGYISTLEFGNGGTFLNSSQQLVYRPPNIVGSAVLYNPTYLVQVDDFSVGTPPTNSVTSASSTPPAITSVVTVTAVIPADEPNGQATADNITVDSVAAPFFFDEIGLKNDAGDLLTHLVFSPFEKTSNRAFKIVYTLTISVS